MSKRPGSSGSFKKRTCPLSDPSIGIVSENDHKVGLCLCRFCDCGEHTCPLLSKHEIYPKSAFRSSYMKDFQKSSFDSPLKPQQKLFRPNTHKMDLTTSHQVDYRPISISPVKKEEVHYDNNKPKFMAGSQYANDFPNWGGNTVTHEKRWYAPLRSTEIPFGGKSTYKETYITHDPESIEKFHTDISQLKASKSNISFAPKDKFDGQTTYAHNMRDYSHNGLNSKVIVVAQKPIDAKAPQIHFKTTNSNYFTRPRNHPNPRLYKLQLISRSISVGNKKSN